MEILDIAELKKFQKSKVIKKVPMLSDQLMVTLYYIDSKTRTPEHNHNEYDEIQYIVEGEGIVSVGNKESQVQKGNLIMVSKNEQHCYTTASEQMVVLAIGMVSDKLNSDKLDKEIRIKKGGEKEV
jgi:quercetin dioxygenase-like cupin family protein